MVLSRALREARDRNIRSADLAGFAEMLLAVLDDPAVAESVADAVTLAGVRRHRASTRPAVTSVTGARELKAARIAAGRGQRG